MKSSITPSFTDSMTNIWRLGLTLAKIRKWTVCLLHSPTLFGVSFPDTAKSSFWHHMERAFTWPLMNQDSLCEEPLQSSLVPI